MNSNSNNNALEEAKKLNKESAQKAAQAKSNFQMEAGTESYLEETKKLNAKSKNANSSNSSSTSSSN